MENKIVKTNNVKKIEHGVFDDAATAMNNMVKGTADMLSGVPACPTTGYDLYTERITCPTGQTETTCKTAESNDNKYYCK